MWAKRAREYLAKINTGEPPALAEVVRDLQSAGDGSNTSFSQRNLFELALEWIAGEFVAVRPITKPDAIELLSQTLADARANRAGAHPRVIVCADPRIALAKPLRLPYVVWTALFSVGLSYLAYATSSPFGAPNMKSIPVRTARIAGLQGE